MIIFQKLRKHFAGSIFVILLLLSGYLFGQTTVKISGTIRDEGTKEPVPFATVFLANTTFGGTANDNGNFLISNVPVGKYSLVVSSLGYKRIILLIEVTHDTANVNILLKPETTVLKEVTVTDNPKEYQKNLQTFKRYFLGVTENSVKCTIQNVTDITFNYDEDKRVFTARAEKPIIIDNLALGYEVTYILDLFKVDYKTGYCFISGIPRFKNLEAKHRRDSNHWANERERAYYGSITHFMRSLKGNQLASNNYTINLLTKVPEVHGAVKVPTVVKNDSLYYQQPISEIQLARLSDAFHPLIEVIYKGEIPEWRYAKKTNASTPQISYLQFSKHKLVIHDNGYYEDPLTFFTDGYWSWSDKVADLMPLEYLPEQNESGRFYRTTGEGASDTLSQTQERNKFYNGSFRHFMKSLMSHTLTENGFSVLIKKNGAFAPSDLEFMNLSDSIEVTEVKVVYKDPPDRSYPNREKLAFQTSTLHLSKQFIKEYNDQTTDFEKYHLEGYFKWSGKFAELTPVGFGQRQ